RLPPAPGRFSTTTGAPSAGASFSESTRAIRSGELPAGKGTIRWIARDGQIFASVASCASAPAAQTSTRATADARANLFRGKAEEQILRAAPSERQLISKRGTNPRVEYAPWRTHSNGACSG